MGQNKPKQQKESRKKNESRGKKTLRRYRRGDWMDWSDGSLQVISVNLCVPQIYSLFRHVPAHQFVRRPSLEKWPRTENVTERYWNSVREREAQCTLWHDQDWRKNPYCITTSSESWSVEARTLPSPGSGWVLYNRSDKHPPTKRNVTAN